MNKLVFEDGHVEEVSDAVWNMSVAKSEKIQKLEEYNQQLASMLKYDRHCGDCEINEVHDGPCTRHAYTARTCKFYKPVPQGVL